MPKGFRVAPVEGRMIVEPFTIGSQHRRLGYSRAIEGETIDPLSGERVPRVVWNWNGDTEIVVETTDQYIRKAIECGDLDYVGTVTIGPAGIQDEPLDATLVKRTLENVSARIGAVTTPAKALGPFPTLPAANLTDTTASAA
jgi:hypothetical protein